PPLPTSTPIPYTTLFRSRQGSNDRMLITRDFTMPSDRFKVLAEYVYKRKRRAVRRRNFPVQRGGFDFAAHSFMCAFRMDLIVWRDRKSTRLNSSHQIISY